ncbi:hypothetical protein [Neobacillus sp. 19]|uniref:hypothetical protein n=1 Tax=Neobacillus sp. 19 TaxID=3394458 RepID=UPI003BF75F63
MEKVKSNQMSSNVFGGIFIIFGIWMVNIFQGSESISEKILFFLVAYFMFYMGIYVIFNKLIEKYKILSIIFKKVLSIPIIVIFIIQYFAAPILSAMMFLAFYFIPSLIILNVSNTYPFISQSVEGIIYIVSLISVLIFAYKGNKVMAFFVETFNTVFAREILHKFSSPYYTRPMSYFLMICIYVIYNFDYFSGGEIVRFIPTELLTVIKEVFVTFVAVDTLIQIIVNNKEKQKLI